MVLSLQELLASLIHDDESEVVTFLNLLGVSKNFFWVISTKLSNTFSVL